MNIHIIDSNSKSDEEMSNTLPSIAYFVRSPKKFNVYLCQKVPFVLACFDVSAAPRLENPDSDEKEVPNFCHTRVYEACKKREFAFSLLLLL
jgi:hypothetical protein